MSQSSTKYEPARPCSGWARAIWGKGFEVDRVGSLPCLAHADVVYSGDLDTHGFAILNRLCAWLPQTRSLLTDRDTPMAYRDRWVAEASPVVSQLNRLTRCLPVSVRSQPEVVLADTRRNDERPARI